ncbi:MAG: hypothetical protein RI969_1156 [Verrucomicrobiota bacterium]|jgi:hypothetical protein
MGTKIRLASESDLPGILKVEESWPVAGRAGADKFLARLRNFGRGFFVATVDLPAGGERIIGTLTSMPLSYEPARPHAFTNWDAVTHEGYLGQCRLEGCNALYIVSGVIDAEYRTLNVFPAGVLAVTALARDLGMSYVLAGAVLPGYRRFCEEHGEMPPFDYCRRRRGDRLVDPLLALYEGIGFEVPDADHVLREYYPDDASRNHAALVRRDLRASPLPPAGGPPG